jgi:cell division GTPase FtsZ
MLLLKIYLDLAYITAVILIFLFIIELLFDIINRKIKQMEEKMVTINIDSSLNEDIMIIGAGEAGGRIAQEFKAQGFSNVVAINSSTADLDALSIPAEQKLLIPVTGGEGAGKNPGVIRSAVDEFYADAASFINKHRGTASSAIVIVGGGGGTGGGLGIVLAQVVSELGLRVGMIFTLPVKNESTLVFINALDNLKEIYQNVTNAAISPFIVVDNSVMTNRYNQGGISEIWKYINEAVVKVIRGFTENSKRPSKGDTLDGAELKRLFAIGGSCAVGSAEILESDTQEDILSKIENSFFVEGFDLTTAKACGIIVVGSNETLSKPSSRKSIDSIYDTAAKILAGGMIFRGVYDQEDVSYLRVYLMFNGLMLPDGKLSEMTKDIRTGYDKMKSQENRIGDGVHVSFGSDVANAFGDNSQAGGKIVRNAGSMFNKPSASPSQAAPKINIVREPKESTPDVKRRER